jgi:replicative DNA helicase
MENIWKRERTRRLEDAKRACHFGIKYLDDAIPGILPSDLVVIGARTGSGKTELSTLIAKKNVFAGKKVLYIALEVDEIGEIERRLKYQEINYVNPDLKLRFETWRLGGYDENNPDLEKLDENIVVRCADEFKNLFVYYPPVDEFYGKDLVDTLNHFQSENFDLIIIDHLHYLEFEGSNEIIGIKKNMMLIRESVTKKRIPIILISHLRKATYASKAITPQLDELYGSSEITKRASHAISFASVHEIGDDEYEPPATVFEVIKTRWANGQGYLGAINFDTKSKSYNNLYVLYRLKDRFCTSAELVKRENLPSWAKNATIAPEKNNALF